ncbi:MAG: dual specificity protein phosphatase [Myxococcota bacterium]
MLAIMGLDLDILPDWTEEPFNRITPTLYLGARPRPEHLEALKGAGITHVVSCLDEEERPKMDFLKQHFHLLFLAVHDGIHQDIASTFPDLFAFAIHAQESQPHAKLLIHCQAGVSRSATLVTALLMKSGQKTFFEAFSEVRSKRAEVLPNIGFASQLQHFEHALCPHASGADDTSSSLARYLHHVCKVPVDADTLQEMLDKHDQDAFQAIQAIFGDDIPRVIQGVRL